MTLSRRIHPLVVTSIIFVVGQLCPAASQRGPALQNLQKDRVTICWEAPRPHAAEVRLLDSENHLLRTVASESKTRRHEVVVEGLEPSRQYAYEVVAEPGSKRIGGGTFRSVPAKGQPFSFVAWGDSRSNERVCSALAGQILRSGVGMCVHSGDIVDHGPRLDHWDKQFFGPCGELMRNVVIWPAVGNHDTGLMPDEKTPVFNHMFALPGNERYYSFDYGDAHFIVLDTTGPLEQQADFIEKDLSENDAKWLFAVWHHPPFGSGGHESHMPSRHKFLPLLAKHNVDLLIVGHNHHFMVSRPIRHVYEPQQKHAYRQMVTGGGGANPYDIHEETRWFGQGIKAYHVVLIEVDGEVLNASAIDQNGRVLQRFEIDHSKPTKDAVPYELIELERYLASLNISNTNLQGWPSGLVVKPGDTRDKLVYTIRNPLPKPITLNIRFDVSRGLKFDREKLEVEVPGEQSVEVEAPFRVADAGSLYPMAGPVVTFESTLGNGEVRMEAPPVALGRKIVAHRTEETIQVDGAAKERAWSEATDYGRFVIWRIGELEYESPENESTLRALHDGKNLYLLLQRPGKDFEERDRYSVYLASPHKALGIDANVKGEHSFTGTAGIDEGVVAVCTKDEGGVRWEIKVPLAKFREDLASPDEPLKINVMEARGNTFFTLAPTFRQHPNRTNSAALVLE